MALVTGLRASELASLTRKSLELKSEPATWTIAPKDEKARRGETFALPSNLVSILQDGFEGAQPDDLLWPGKWAKNKEAGKFLKKDLAAARSQWILQGESPEDRESRNASTFQCHEYADGEVMIRLDFHELRHTFVTRLSRSGASPKSVQTLARHSTMALTYDRYIHVDRPELDAAIPSLEPLPNPYVHEAVDEALVSSRGSMVAGLVAGSADTERDPLRSIESNRPFQVASL